jgi:hypothetical protein
VRPMCWFKVTFEPNIFPHKEHGNCIVAVGAGETGETAVAVGTADNVADESVESRFCCISHVGTDSAIESRKEVIRGAPYSMLRSQVILVIGNLARR